ncbi:MAG: hypothetical protein AB1298_07685 [Bacteroidota bacterium]
MNATEKDFATDKIKLIYEFNNSSPLFARVAQQEIERGNILEAVKILEKGMALHPSYPTPYFILALAYAYSGKGEEANSFADIGSKLINSYETFEYYQKKIIKIISDRNLMNDLKRPGFLSGNEEEKDDVNPDNLWASISLEEDKLELLAEKLSKAKIPKDAGEPIPSFDQTEDNVPAKKIISETMAEIFLAQKNYSEAILIYEELIEQKPEKAGFFMQKISEIKNQK